MGLTRMKIKDSKGQSTIEFIFSFSLALGFIFGFLKLSIVYTNGFLIHYATFQASRAYMVGESGSKNPDGSDPSAAADAKQVFDNFKLDVLMPDFPNVITFEEPSARSTMQSNLYIGARVEFNEFIAIPGSNAKIEIPMISESYLGMEPTRAECFQQICASLSDVGGAGCVRHATVFDNGC
jgi:hypothetical protein